MYTHNPTTGVILDKIIPVYIDGDFQPSETANIIFAVDEWNKAMNGYSRFRIESFAFQMDDSTLEKIRDKYGLIILNLKEGNKILDWYSWNHTLACTNDIGGNIIFVASDKTKENLHRVMLHELGHVIGLKHWGMGQKTLMSPDIEHVANCIDKETMLQLAELHPHWDFNRLNYCID